MSGSAWKKFILQIRKQFHLIQIVSNQRQFNGHLKQLLQSPSSLRKLTVIYNSSWLHLKLKPIGYDSSIFNTPVIRNDSPEQLNFSANFRDSYRELMPKLLEVSPHIGNFKESEKARERSDVWCLNACNQSRKRKFRENNSITCNHQQCGLKCTSKPHSHSGRLATHHTPPNASSFFFSFCDLTRLKYEFQNRFPKKK